MSQNSLFDEPEEEKLGKLFRAVNTVHLKDEEFSDYLENKASLFTNLRVEAHLANCNFCRDELQMLKELHHEGPGELDSEMTRQIKKVLAYIPVRVPVKVVKTTRNQTFIFDIGTLGFQFAALGTRGKTASDWAELTFSEDKQCVWTYREDDQRNLIFKFTVFLPKPKAVQLTGGDQIWVAPLKPEGNEWIAEVIIPAKDRSRLQSGYDIQIRVING